MLPSEREKLADQVGRAVIRLRSDAQRLLAEATSAGDAKTVRSLSSQLRKIEAQIKKYGLERYAT